MQASFLRPSLLHDMGRRLDIAEALGAAGYGALRCSGQGRRPALPQGVPAWQAELLLERWGDGGPSLLRPALGWSLDPLASASPARYMPAGGNRWVCCQARAVVAGCRSLPPCPSNLYPLHTR